MPPLKGPPTYPLTVDEFKDAVRKGLGRAVIHLRHVGDTTPFRGIVRDACLHDQRFEVTVGPHRSAFHADLVEACSQPTSLADELMSFLGAAPQDSDEWVLAELAYELARRGNKHADEAWWTFVGELSKEDIATYGEDLVLLGERGLLLFAERIGGDLEEDDCWRYTRSIEDGDGAYGEGWTKAVLRRESEIRPQVAAFLLATEEWERITQNVAPPPPERAEDGWRAWSQAWPMLEAWSRDRNMIRPFSHILWARNAPTSELAAAAHTFLQQREEDKIRAIANVLKHRPWPLDITLLIEFLRQLPTNTADTAMLATRCTEHPALREECRYRCALGQITSNLFELMQLNTQPGDASWIEDALTRHLLDEYTIHSIGLNLKQLPMVQSLPEAAGIREWLYEHDPCCFCREQIIEQIIACADAAATRIMEEARYDSSPDTRMLIEKTFRGEPIED